MTLTRIHVLFFTSLTLSATYAFGPMDKVDEKIVQCDSKFMTSYCPDHLGYAQCLKNISAPGMDDGFRVGEALQSLREKEKKCPGYGSPQSNCLYEHLMTCTNATTAAYLGDKGVCSGTNAARKCLDKIRENCVDDRFDKTYYKDLSELDRRCQEGFFEDNGPCNVQTIIKCRDECFEYVYGSQHFYKYQKGCTDAESKNAEMCLGALKKVCTSKLQQKWLEEELKEVIEGHKAWKIING